MQIHNISKKGDWVFIPFSGSGSVCEAAIINFRNVVMVEVDVDMLLASEIRLTEDLPCRLKNFVQAFDFEKSYMLVHKADTLLPELERRYFIPPFSMKPKAPEINNEEPWHRLPIFEGEQKLSLRKCTTSWNNTSHLRVNNFFLILITRNNFEKNIKKIELIIFIEFIFRGFRR